MMTRIALLLCLATLQLVRCGGDWNYQPGDRGPGHWAGLCQEGRAQSPINIQDAEPVLLDKWNFRNYEALIKHADIVNNGHTLKFAPTDNQKLIPSVSGGGLEDRYILAQLHLHWGNTSQAGSEHLVEGRAFPLELHLVHYNSKYSELGEAVRHDDGLAVVGVLHHLSAEDNPSLQPLMEAARSVKVTHQQTGLTRGVTMKSLLPPVPGSFYRYRGSLTTPGCNEIVTWSVLQRTAPVSEAQLNVLRALTTSDGFTMGNNYRPVTPLNGRKILVSGGVKEARKEVEDGREVRVVWRLGLVPGWAVVLISLAVGLNVGLVVWLVMRRGRRGEHMKLPTEEH